MATQVVMPQLGESVVDGTVLKWLKQENETIKEYESLLEVETAKVTTEIPSPASGTLLKILVPEGKTVLAKTVLAWIGKPGEKLPDLPAKPEIIDKESEAVTVQMVKDATREKRDIGFVSPIVTKLADEYHIDLAQVPGTGENGRITKNDVMTFVETAKNKPKDLPAWETPGTGDLFKPTEMLIPTPVKKNAATVEVKPPLVPSNGDTIIPHTSTRKTIAAHMVDSKHTSAHVTTVMEADLSRVVAHREKNKEQFVQDGIKLTYTPYFISSASSALQKYPIINSSWSEAGIIVHKSIHIGMAVSLGDEGLIVPVIHNADHLSLTGLATQVNQLAEKARNHQLKPDDVTGGTFSITNHGTGKSLFATPIINQPQCAILGIGAITKRAVVVNDAIAIRPIVYVGLTFDHRLIDGSTADAFLAYLVEKLENWE